MAPIGQLHTLAAKMPPAGNMEGEVGILPATEGMAMKDLKEQRKVRSMSKVKALTCQHGYFSPERQEFSPS